jgi:hypothetical protein
MAAAAAFFIAFALWPPDAAAQASAKASCGDHRRIADVLHSKYGEYLALYAEAQGGGLELWVSNRRSFTLLRILPGGIACLIAAGNDIRFSKSTKGRQI